MRYIPIALAALLALTAPASALSEADGTIIGAIITDEDKNDKEAILKYIATTGETATVYEAEAYAKFSQALFIFASANVPQGTTSAIVSDVKDGDGDILVMVFDANDTFVGSAWFGSTVIDAANDYTKGGV
jgi:hypothetical protein